jgi:hypothetical protein
MKRRQWTSLVAGCGGALVLMCSGAFGQNLPPGQPPLGRPEPRPPLVRAPTKHSFTLPPVHNPSLTADGKELALDTKLRAQKQAGDALKSKIMPGPTAGVPGGPGASPQSAASRTLGGNARTAISFDPSLLCKGSIHTPTIVSMNGKSLGEGYFTNDPGANLFTFTGCNFGTTQGQMHLFGTFRSVQVPLTIDFWTDTSIIAHLPSDLTKELDQNSVKLVLVPASGPQTEYINLKFTAARQKMLLMSMPQAEYQTASPTPSTGSPDGSYSFGAARLFSGFAPPGTDRFAFDQLLPGFVISDMQVFPDTNPALAHDQWGSSFTARNAQVTWVVAQDGQRYDAGYAVNIWVSGPVGFTSPWKGDNP